MVVYEYANQLAARGHDVTVVHPRRWDWTEERIRLATDAASRLIAFRWWLSRRIRKDRNPIVEGEVQWYPFDSRVKLLYIPGPKPLFFPNGDAISWYGKDCPPEKGKQFGLIQGYGVFSKALEDALFRVPVPKIVIARWLYEQGLKLGVPPHEMVYIPNGFDHSRYRIVFPIERRSPRIAMLYHPQPVKGAEDGVKALNLARRKFPALQAALFGILPRPRTLPSWIEYYYDVPQDDLINSVYNGSSIYLCPIWTEGFGLPPGEAMCCGCAVASTDCGGIRDFAEHEVTALLSPPKNPGALAENIIRLLENDDLRMRIAKAGNERIREFTWERSTDLLEQFLEGLTGRSNLQAK